MKFSYVFFCNYLLLRREHEAKIRRILPRDGTYFIHWKTRNQWLSVKEVGGKLVPELTIDRTKRKPFRLVMDENFGIKMFVTIEGVEYSLQEKQNNEWSHQFVRSNHTDVLEPLLQGNGVALRTCNNGGWLRDAEHVSTDEAANAEYRFVPVGNGNSFLSRVCELVHNP